MSTNVHEDWEHALVTGNGRQGALVYGGPASVRVTLAHEGLFMPCEPPRDAPDTAAMLPRLRRLLDDGRWGDAARAVCDTARAQDAAYAETIGIDPLIGAATLTVRPEHRGQVRDFHRDVDLGTGVVTLRWADDVGEVCVEVFASRPADAIVLRLSATGGFAGSVRLTPVDGTPPVPYSCTTEVTEDAITLDARFGAATWPGALTGYRVHCRAPGYGTVRGDAVLVVRTLLTEARPGITGDHGELMARTHLDLGVAGARIARLFDQGRYLIVSSTGERPPTLQGVWSGTWTPPWSSGWTLNGNLPAAVAALHPTGTPELMLPLFDLADTMLDDWRHNAWRLYGCRGVLTPTHLSSHGRQNHFGPVWCQTFWTAGAGWLARLYMDHWLYTGEATFLRERALPFMREAAAFLLDFVQIRDGTAVFAPSYSPENAPANTGSQATVTSTMDVAVTRDLLTNLLRVTGDGEPDRERWRALLEALPAYRVADGRLAEWIDPGLDDQPAHRHASHLWPLWYEPDPAVPGDAAARAIRDRLAYWAGAEADEMAYGLAQLGLAAAALGMADEALWCLERMADRYWRPSGVPTHNHGRFFNVDIAGGFPAVVAAMLVRGAHGRLDLLPALPAAWPYGVVSGLRARGGITVERLAWAPGEVSATLSARQDISLTVRVRGEEREVNLEAGARVSL